MKRQDEVIDWDKFIPIIEKAFGFKLYDSQKEYLKNDIYAGGGRNTGKTMAYCIKLDLTHKQPIKIDEIRNFSDEIRDPIYYHWFRRYFLDIHSTLKNSGLPVAELI